MISLIKSLAAMVRCFGVMAFLAGAMACGLGACNKPQERIDSRQFVGVWKSTRSGLPIRMQPNGEWEIRQDDGRVYQYGLWRFEEGKLIWTFLESGKALDDANPVLGIKADEFVIRELNGSATVFRRLPDSN